MALLSFFSCPGEKGFRPFYPSRAKSPAECTAVVAAAVRAELPCDGDYILCRENSTDERLFPPSPGDCRARRNI